MDKPERFFKNFLQGIGESIYEKFEGDELASKFISKLKTEDGLTVKEIAEFLKLIVDAREEIEFLSPNYAFDAWEKPSLGKNDENSVKFREIGNVMLKNGNISAALENYNRSVLHANQTSEAFGKFVYFRKIALSSFHFPQNIAMFNEASYI